jgi:hypothetical protein
MRAKMSFDVHGSTHADIQRRLGQVLVEFFAVETVDEALAKCDVELEIQQDYVARPLGDEQQQHTYSATATVRIRQ